MAADGVTVKVEGIDELKRALKALPGKMRRQVLTQSLRAGARVVQKAARVAAPVLSASTPYRTRGLLKRKISVRVSKASRAAGNVGVFVNVKPAAKSARGSKSPLDPFYWRFVAFGTKAHTIKPKTAKGLAFGGRVVTMVRHPGSKARNFLDAGAAALPAALAAFEAAAIPAIEKQLNKRGA